MATMSGEHFRSLGLAIMLVGVGIIVQRNGKSGWGFGWGLVVGGFFWVVSS